MVLIAQAEEVWRGQAALVETSRTDKIALGERLNGQVKRGGERMAKAVGGQMPGAKGEFAKFASKKANAFALQ